MRATIPPADQSRFAFDDQILSAAFDLGRYERLVSDSSELRVFRSCPSYVSAYALTKNLWHSLAASLTPFSALLLNSSTGKDSSLMVATWIEVALERHARGEHVPHTVVAMADTSSEMPEMAARMQLECSSLNEFASATGLPLEARIVRPPPQDRLLVELIGRGKSLPILADGASATRNGRAWCMDRVKRGPLDTILNSMRGEFQFFAQAIGTRTAESSARGMKVQHYAGFLPFGLTALRDRATGNQHDARTIGTTPIVHWTDDMVAEWLVRGTSPWRPESMRELRQIYHKAATTNEVAGECGLRLTADGGLTSVCSDLGGARLGCWHCLLSANASLRNFAAGDARYEWLRRVHRYIHRHHERNRTRMRMRDEMGFDQHTMFPKAFTFRERYWLLMLVHRAEIESGFTLLQPEDLRAIANAWRREGVWTVLPEEALADARTWRQTGHPRFSYETNAGELDRVVHTLSEGVPAGAYFHLLTDDERGHSRFNPLALAQLVGLTEVGSPITPRMHAYVFRDDGNPDLVFVMVTDLPSNLGTKLDNNKLNETHLGRWRCTGARPLANWEHRFSDGRIFFYRFSRKSAVATIERLSHNPKDPALYRAIDLLHENVAMHAGRHDRDLFADHVYGQLQIARLPCRFSAESYRDFKELVIQAMFLSEELCDNASAARRALRREFGDRLLLLSDDSDAGAAARREFERAARESYRLDALVPVFTEYIHKLRLLASYIRSGFANAAMIERLIYLVQLAAVDDEGVAELQAFERDILRPNRTDRRVQVLAA